jgi:hypothetical protein
MFVGFCVDFPGTAGMAPSPDDRVGETMAEEQAPPTGTSPVAPLPPEGWYADPDGKNQQRYWDGGAWTEQIAPNMPAPSAAEKPSTTGIPRIVSLLCCVGLMIGAFAPWATTALASESGTHGDGTMTGLFGLVAGIVLCAYAGKRPGWLTLTGVFAVIALLVAISDISNVSNYNTSFFGQEVHVVSVGWGLWLTAVSAFGLIGGTVTWRAEERKRKAAEVVEAVKTTNE